MINNLYFYTGIAGFILAIFISSFASLGISFLLMLLIIGISIFIFGKYIASGSNRKIILIVSVFIFFFAFGGIRYEIKNIRHSNPDLEENIGKKVLLEGLIIEEPVLKENNQTLTIRLKDISKPNKILIFSLRNSLSFKQSSLQK